MGNLATATFPNFPLRVNIKNPAQAKLGRGILESRIAVQDSPGPAPSYLCLNTKVNCIRPFRSVFEVSRSTSE